MKEITVLADNKNLPKVMEFVEGCLEEFDIPTKTKIQLDVAIDEIFSNIANYAYKGGQGEATVIVEIPDDENYILIEFKDSGKEFNPLEAKDPDITLSAEEREIGGLGILMVKKSMDNISYEYANGMNILKIKKNY